MPSPAGTVENQVITSFHGEDASFNRPFGTLPQRPITGIEMPGYCHVFLRNKRPSARVQVSERSKSSLPGFASSGLRRMGSDRQNLSTSFRPLSAGEGSRVRTPRNSSHFVPLNRSGSSARFWPAGCARTNRPRSRQGFRGGERQHFPATGLLNHPANLEWPAPVLCANKAPAICIP
jgi:hypothetical protein